MIQTRLPAMTAQAAFSTANTNRDGTGTIADLVTALATTSGGVGAFVNKILLKATATTTAGMLRLYRKISGGSYRLVKEIAVSAATPSGTVKGWNPPSTEEGYDPETGALLLKMQLAPGEILAISTHNAEAFVATVEYNELSA